MKRRSLFEFLKHLLRKILRKIRDIDEVPEVNTMKDNQVSVNVMKDNQTSILLLSRGFHSTQCTIGTLYLHEEDGREIELCKTLELPWMENKRRISCIPTGTYDITKHIGSNYPTEKDIEKGINHVLRLKNVPDRGGILVHPGNYPQDTVGCILVGRDSVNQNMVTSSRETLKELLKVLEEHHVSVIKIISSY